MKIFLWGLGLLGSTTLLAPASAQNAPQQVSAARSATLHPVAAAKLMQQPNVVVLDVRTPAEYATGHLKGAQNLDFRSPDFAQQVARLDTTKTYVLYCASGNRSGQAATVMQAQGFPKVVNAGSYRALAESGLKTE